MPDERIYRLSQLEKITNKEVKAKAFQLEMREFLAIILGNLDFWKNEGGKWLSACMAGESRSAVANTFLAELGLEVDTEGGAVIWEELQNLLDNVRCGVRKFVFFPTESRLPLNKLVKVIEKRVADLVDEGATLDEDLIFFIVQADEGEVPYLIGNVKIKLEDGYSANEQAKSLARDEDTGTTLDYRITA